MRGRGESERCVVEFLLVLHVSFTNGVCYIMIKEALLLFCCRQWEEGGRREVDSRRRKREASHRVSCLIVVDFFLFLLSHMALCL